MGKAADDLKDKKRARDEIGGLHGDVSTADAIASRAGGYNEYLERHGKGEEEGSQMSYAEWQRARKGK